MKLPALALIAFTGAPFVLAQAGPQPFKLGTFSQGGRTFVGLVLDDTTVVEIAAANRAFESRNPSWPKVPAPQDMRELIVRYPTGLGDRIRALASQGSRAAAHVHELKGLTVRPPVMPGLILNAALNYTEHEREMTAGVGAQATAPAAAPASIPGLWERRPDDTRHNPYLFLKAPNAVIAHGESIRVPRGRDRIDWECEMTLVIGRPATRVPVTDAADYIFGYTLQNDVSDREARGDGRHGSDWLIAKSHDTFAPLGPFIVPREFVKDPQKLRIRFSLNGQVMQDSSTERMTHDVRELVSFASQILTLRPGDVIATGSAAGVGAARNPPIFLKAGDRADCSVEGIGTLTNPVEGPVSQAGVGQGTGLVRTAWRLEDLGGIGVRDRAPTLEFPEAGRVVGSGSCNRFFGTVEIAGGTIKFGPLGSTRMACDGAVGIQEAKYLKALQDAERVTIEGSALTIHVRGMEKPLRFVRTAP